MPRLPELERNDKNAAAYDYLHKTRGAVRGGFAVMLASPDVCQRMAHVGTYIRFESPIPANIKELATVAVSAELENPAETTAHTKPCRDLKVSESALKAALERSPITEASDDERLAI